MTAKAYLEDLPDHQLRFLYRPPGWVQEFAVAGTVVQVWN